MGRKWNLKRLLREDKEWVSSSDSKTGFYDEPRKEIEQAIASEPTPPDLRVFKRKLHWIAKWEAQHGTVLVSEGDQAGWSHICASVRYDGWALRLGVALRERNEEEPVDLDDACRCLAGSIALRQDAFADWCGLQLINCIETGNDIFLGWDRTPFEPFMVKLYALWRGQDIDVRRPGICPLGVYQRVFDAWESEQAFAAALGAICDYHCKRIDPDRLFHEFSWSPYDVFPAEILALQRVRQELGLPQVTIEHPLLDNPLARLPEEIVPVHDELMERAIDWIQRMISSELDNLLARLRTQGASHRPAPASDPREDDK